MTRPGQLERTELNEEQARIYDAILETRGSIAGPFGIWLHSPGAGRPRPESGGVRSLPHQP